MLGRSVKKIVTSSNSLRDILKELSSDKEESWNILEAFLTQHPEIIDRWLAQKVGFNEENSIIVHAVSDATLFNYETDILNRFRAVVDRGLPHTMMVSAGTSGGAS